jgi:ribosomal protein S18 acetylase RimI-like enzyme
VLTHRPAATIDDLVLAGESMSRAWQSGSPSCVATPAAIEWWHASSWPDPLEANLRLWFDDGEVVGWTWHDDGELEGRVWTGDVGRDRAVAAAITETVGAETTGPLAVWSADDDPDSIATFERLGFVRADRRLSQWQRRESEGAPAPPPLPDGYAIRPLHGPEELQARVDVHRSAFPTSRLNVPKYERLTRMPHYRFEDDIVVEAPDGSFAAFAMAWWDPAGRVGEFEPVGTHPAHQRRGLARALLTFGLDRYFERGARVVQVYADASEAGPEALYEAIGFRRRAFHLRFERPGADLQSTP